jgi:AmiR/NasT family two-component response regulator
VNDDAIRRLAATVERLRDEARKAQATADGRALTELAKGVLVERLRRCCRWPPKSSTRWPVTG